MNEVKQYKTQMRKSFKKGLLLIALTVWFIPGIFFRLISFPPKNEDGFVNWLFNFSYGISPRITSIQELISSAPKEGAGALLTTGNVLALIVVMVFAVGCAMVSGASKQHDKYHEIKQQARYDQMKEELKGR